MCCGCGVEFEANDGMAGGMTSVMVHAVPTHLHRSRRGQNDDLNTPQAHQTEEETSTTRRCCGTGLWDRGGGFLVAR